MENLNDLREQIDKVDNQLIKLLEERFEIVKKIGKFKKKNDIPILDKSREASVLNNIKLKLKNESDFHFYRKIYQLLMDISKEMEE